MKRIKTKKMSPRGHFRFLSFPIQTLLSAQDFHLFNSQELAGYNRRYGISPIPKDYYILFTNTVVGDPTTVLIFNLIAIMRGSQKRHRNQQFYHPHG